VGDFIVYREEGIAPKSLTAVERCLAHQGSINPRGFSCGVYRVSFYPKSISPINNCIQRDNGDFCGCTGTFIYKGLMAEEALAKLLDDFDPSHYPSDQFNGIFSIILCKSGRLFLLTDPLGGSRVYHNPMASFLSSSFLACCYSAEILRANSQSVYEYAFNGAVFGEQSVFQEISCLSSLHYFEFTTSGLQCFDKNLARDLHSSRGKANQPRVDQVDAALEALRSSLAPVVEYFGSRVKTALSGGYDSRLLLALLKDFGVTPDVYVYGSESSCDVQVAKTIARGEGFKLQVVDKSTYQIPKGDSWRSIIQDNFYALDGISDEGIFDNGSNMYTRRQRSAGERMVLNGGGGEIFRNFYYLPNRCFHVSQLLDIFYSQYCSSFCRSRFDQQDYRQQLAAKLLAALEVSEGRLSRELVEYSYPLFRLRYWTCLENSNYSRLGGFFMPYISYPVLCLAANLPISWKNHGTFQASMISKLSPSLAAYQSDYGYSFDRPPPRVIRMNNVLNYWRPAVLRRYSYAIKQNLFRRCKSSGEHFDPYNQCFPSGFKRMDYFFDVGAIKDAVVLNRIASLEYLFEHFEVG